MVGFAHLDARGFHRQAFLPRIEPDQRLPLAHEIARGKEHARHPPGGFGEDFRRGRRARGPDRFDFELFGQDADILRHHRHRIAFRFALGLAASGCAQHQDDGEKSEKR